MNEYESLSHTTWDCKYHVVFIPKCRRKTLYQELRRHLGEVFRRLALQKELKVEEGHLMPDHVHMLLSIPPKYAVSQVVGFIKGKSAIHMARVYGERKRNFVGDDFRPGDSSSTRSGAMRKPSAPTFAIKRRKIKRLEQMNLWRIHAALGGSKFEGPRQRPLPPLRAAPILKPPAGKYSPSAAIPDPVLASQPSSPHPLQRSHFRFDPVQLHVQLEPRRSRRRPSRAHRKAQTPSYGVRDHAPAAQLRRA